MSLRPKKNKKMRKKISNYQESSIGNYYKRRIWMSGVSKPFFSHKTRDLYSTKDKAVGAAIKRRKQYPARVIQDPEGWRVWFHTYTLS